MKFNRIRLLRLLFVLAVTVSAMAPAYFTAEAQDVPQIIYMKRLDLYNRLNDPDIVILDARADSDWKYGDAMIPGAIRVPPADFGRWLYNQPKDKKYVVYCACLNNGQSYELAKQMLPYGFEMYVLDEGWTGWIQNRYPTAPKQEVDLGLPK